MRRLHLLCLAVVLCAASIAAADVYSVPAIEKISPTQPPTAAWSKSGVSVQCARNEWEAFQIVSRSEQPTKGLSVELSDLRGPKGAVLPAKLARVYRVQWVDINAPYEPDKPSTNPNPEADPLVPVKPGERFDAEAGQNLVFFIALNVPEATKPGMYTGQVKIGPQSLPLRLQVRSFALPREPILQSMIGFSDANIYKAHGCKTPQEKEQIIRLYFDEYIRARLSPFLYFPGTVAFNPLPDGSMKWEFVKGADGKPTGEVKLDFATFDREGQRYFNERQAFSALNFAPYLWIRRDKKVVLRFVDRNGTAIERRTPEGEINPVFDQVVISVFRGIAAHLAEKGWLDRAVVYVTDEPSDDDTPAIKEICQLLRQADPRLRTALTYDPANRPKLAELVDEQGKSLISLWIPYCTMYKQSVADEQRKKGADYWLYDVSSTCLIGQTGLTNRSIMWDIWRRDCHGYLYYLSTWWGRDVTPWDRPSFLLPEFTYRYRQGDGYFFYPPLRQYNPDQPILDHVVPTIRWEMLREGAEDYDYLAMLEDLTKRAEQRKLKVAAGGRKAMQVARDMSESMSGVVEGHAIRDLAFEPTAGWTFSREEGWLSGNSEKPVALPISFKTSLPDGKYRLTLNVYDDTEYRGAPYSRFLINGKPYASPQSGMKTGTNVPTEIVTVKDGQCDFVLSNIGGKSGVIVYSAGLQRVVEGRGDLYSVRSQVADAIEKLQAAVK